MLVGDVLAVACTGPIEPEVLGDSQPVEDPAILRDLDDPSAHPRGGGCATQILAFEAHGASDRLEQPGTKVLAVSGLSVAFGGVHALEDVDLVVNEGELVGLIGPNGAGKTTFVDAITGFVGFTGTVMLDGRDIGRLPPYERSRRGLARTWQSTDLFDDLDVRENLTVAAGRGTRSDAADASADASAQADETLAGVGLAWASAAMPAELSQGQRKLVGLARALAGRPRLLCLDEPAAGLDTRESEELGRLLRSFADRGQSTLLIDHDMAWC